MNNLDKSKFTFVDKTWGGETIYINCPITNLCLKKLTVYPGFMSSLHYHAEKTEWFLIIKGDIMLETFPLEDESKHTFIRLKPSDIFLLMPKTVHRFAAANGTVAEFLEISTYSDDKDSFRLEPSGPII